MNKIIREFDKKKYVLRLEVTPQTRVWTLNKVIDKYTLEKVSRLTFNTLHNNTSIKTFKGYKDSPIKLLGFNYIKKDLVIINEEESAMARLRMNTEMDKIIQEINLAYVFKNEEWCHDYVRNIKWSYVNKRNEPIK